MTSVGKADLSVTVLITLLNDKRVLRALPSVEEQVPRPVEILVADGGSSDGSWEAVLQRSSSRIKVLQIRGSVATTRNRALGEIRGEIVAFLDADEVAPPHWLMELTGPILRGEADFTGGPTRPLGPARSGTEAFLNAYDAWFYENFVARDISFLPMGNSAWKMSVLKEIGGFDERLSWGGEDYDVTIRALRAGFRGKYVPSSWVYHDQSHLDTTRKAILRKYKYSVGATMAYVKNGVLRRKAIPAIASSRYLHPVESFGLVMKPIALLHGSLAWTLRKR